MKHDFLKLVFLAGASHKSIISAKLYSDCRNDNLIINVPVKQEKAANILKLSAGNCTEENVPGGVEKVLKYDSVNEIASLTLPIEECDLRGELYADPITELKSGKYYYMPTANVTLGYLRGDVEIKYRTLHIAAECAGWRM